MLRFLVTRLTAMVFMLAGVVVGAFVLTHVVPADPARMIAGLRASQEQVDAVRAELGLDDPLLVQFGRFLNDILHGDLGSSAISHRPVVDDIARYFPATFELVLFAVLLMVALGVPAGVYAALGRRAAVKSLVKVLGLIAMGVPVFVLGLVLQRVFFGNLGWLPSGQRITGGAPNTVTGLHTVDALLTGNLPALGSALVHLVLPAGALALYRAGMVMRFVESQLDQTMNADYIRTARAKGAGPRRLVWGHMVRNASLPVVSMIGLEFGWLLSGSVLVESIFSWPGMGSYMIESILAFDFAPVVACALVLAGAFALINLVVDIVQRLIDPRIALS